MLALFTSLLTYEREGDRLLLAGLAGNDFRWTYSESAESCGLIGTLQDWISVRVTEGKVWEAVRSGDDDCLPFCPSNSP